MPLLTRSLTSSAHSHFFWRWSSWAVVILLIVTTNLVVVTNTNQRLAISEQDATSHNQDALFFRATKHLLELKMLTTQAEKLGADVTPLQAQTEKAKTLIFINHSPLAADQLLRAAIAAAKKLIASQTAANAAAEAAKQQGGVMGTAKEGATPLSGVKVSLLQNNQIVTSTLTDTHGMYLLMASAGNYSLTASKGGYTSVSQKSLTVTSGQTLTNDLTLTKAPTGGSSGTTTTSGLTNGDSAFSVQTINANGTNYTVDVATFNLASGEFRVITDTANNDDCLDNCPTKSLSSYVSDNGGFAGMNGTYFCPADYSSCAGKTGSYYWKVWNSRLAKMINGDTNSFLYEPFLTVNGNTGKYYNQWADFNGSITAGISSSPALISGGRNVLDQSKLDDKQRTVKSNRGGAGFKGQTLYFVIAKSATVIDLGNIMSAMGLDYGMNLDGGGSSAMIFNGSYKVGPGRNIPNAIIVARR